MLKQKSNLYFIPRRRAKYQIIVLIFNLRLTQVKEVIEIDNAESVRYASDLTRGVYDIIFRFFNVAGLDIFGHCSILTRKQLSEI